MSGNQGGSGRDGAADAASRPGSDDVAGDEERCHLIVDCLERARPHIEKLSEIRQVNRGDWEEQIRKNFGEKPSVSESPEIERKLSPEEIVMNKASTDDWANHYPPDESVKELFMQVAEPHELEEESLNTMTNFEMLMRWCVAVTIMPNLEAIPAEDYPQQARILHIKKAEELEQAVGRAKLTNNPACKLALDWLKSRMIGAISQSKEDREGNLLHKEKEARKALNKILCEECCHNTKLRLKEAGGSCVCGTLFALVAVGSCAGLYTASPALSAISGALALACLARVVSSCCAVAEKIGMARQQPIDYRDYNRNLRRERAEGAFLLVREQQKDSVDVSIEQAVRAFDQKFLDVQPGYDIENPGPSNLILP